MRKLTFNSAHRDSVVNSGERTSVACNHEVTRCRFALETEDQVGAEGAKCVFDRARVRIAVAQAGLRRDVE